MQSSMNFVDFSAKCPGEWGVIKIETSKMWYVLQSVSFTNSMLSKIQLVINCNISNASSFSLISKKLITNIFLHDIVFYPEP